LSTTDPYSIGREFFNLLQSASVVLRLAPRFRRVPFRTVTPADTGAGGTFAWRAEGLPSALTKSTTATLQQERYEADFTILTSAELYRLGAVAEQMLEAMVVFGLARGLDGQFLDRTVGVTTAHPASPFFGTSVLSSAGSTAANIATDLSALIADVTGPTTGEDLVFIMRPTTYANIAAKMMSVGCPVERGYLCGLPVVLSSTSPRQIALLDCSNVAYSSDDAIALDLTSQADVQMDSAPSQSGISGSGSAMVSLFQSGLVGIRAQLPIAWQPIHYNTGSPTVVAGAAVMSVAY
jgi:hypothetical protein